MKINNLKITDLYDLTAADSFWCWVWGCEPLWV